MFKMNSKKSSIGAYISSHYAELGRCKTKNDIVSFIEKGRTSENASYLDTTVIPSIKNARSLSRAMQVLANIDCAGAGMRSI